MNDFRALPPGAQPDPFSQAPAADGESPFAVIGRFHRLLRGRYHLAIPVAALCAAVGAYAGYRLTTPKYEGVGKIRIQSVIPLKIWATPENGMLPMFQAYVRTQANYLQDDRVIAKAVGSKEWQALGRGLSPEAQDQFRRSFQVDTDPRDQEWIFVKFRDTDPKAARLAVEQIIDAYKTIFGPDEIIVSEQLINDLKANKSRIEREIDTLNREVRTLSQKWVTSDLETLHHDRLEDLRELERTVTRLEMQIKQAEAAAKVTAEKPAAGEPDADAISAQIAAVDEIMRGYLSRLVAARLELARVSGSYGPAHRTVKSAQQANNAAQEAVDKYRAQWLDAHNGALPLSAPGELAVGPVSAEQLPNLKMMYDQYKAQLDEKQQLTFALNDDRLALQRLQASIKERQAVVSSVQTRLDQVTTESAPSENAGISQRIKIFAPTEDPYRPASDSRKKLAAFGLLLGGGLPLGAFMLWGLMDRRFRYSDDAGSGRLTPTLLGILPYLPDQMADPEQAAVAAHCVHQIRTLLQISGAHQDRRVFAITSPTAGDGKTSLSLSLGLSFAASGSETCLIDFDMIGGGLSSSMQSKAEVGLMDALDHGQLNGHIRPTAFPRLSILPVGVDDAMEVSRLSPELVQRIIDEAKRRFDVVIIDTGPILGSIEAGLVSAAADGVILTLGRGQSRTQAERAMTHLSNLGATLIGVVFNRADPGDFRRAVSSASVRSVPLQNGSARRPFRALPELGPMANTVASQSGPGPESQE